MTDSTNNAICPQCGAQGTAGRFCEYCGTKIPEPIIENKQEDDNTPFSWYNVIPDGFKISEKDVIGDPQKSLFMVVKSGETRQYVQTEYVLGDDNYRHPVIRTRDKEDYQYGIINRQGKFVVDCNKDRITFYQETNFYYSRNTLQNLITGKIIVGGDKHVSAVYGTTFLQITDGRGNKVSLFDIKTDRFIELPHVLSDLNSEYKNCWVDCSSKEGKLEFHKGESTGNKTKHTYWKVQIKDGRAVIIDTDSNIDVKKDYTGCVFAIGGLFIIAIIAMFVYSMWYVKNMM